MRGKVLAYLLQRSRLRITPAYAGKSGNNSLSDNAFKDHPRLCGEKCEMPSTAFLYLGSPPPMRGKVFPLLSSCQTGGITPAYAGKSRSSVLTSRCP